MVIGGDAGRDYISPVYQVSPTKMRQAIGLPALCQCINAYCWLPSFSVYFPIGPNQICPGIGLSAPAKNRPLPVFCEPNRPCSGCAILAHLAAALSLMCKIAAFPRVVYPFVSAGQARFRCIWDFYRLCFNLPFPFMFRRPFGRYMMPGV